MNRTLITFALVVLIPTAASARELGSAKNARGEITALGKGLKEFGAESLFVLSYEKQGTNSTFRASTITGLVFRWFVARNVSLDVNLSFLYKNFGNDVSTAGAYGGLTISYNLRLGRNFFFRPGVGAGGFYGISEAPAQGNTVVESSVFGGVARLRAMFAYYVSSRFSLQAGPELAWFFGRIDPDVAGATSESYFTTDGGFGVGASYVF